MNQHEKLNYVEFHASNLKATQIFFENCFGWSFTYFGEGYMAFDFQGLEGGFFQSSKMQSCRTGAPLLVFYSQNLEQTLEKVKANNATITEDIFSFPGGRRFHFAEPSGNEFAVWSDN